MPADTTTVKKKLDATAQAARTTATRARETAAEAADAARDTAEDVSASARSRLRSVGSDLADRASTAAQDLRDGAADRLDGARSALADAGDRLAATLRDVADRPDAPAVQAKALGALSDGASAVAGTLRERNLTEMAGDVRALARRHPAAFAAGAAAVGFILARMLRANSRRGD